MPDLAIAPEGAYSDIEHDLIENEPPGLFPIGQDSYWGQMRKLHADYLQVLADQLTTWYGNLDPRTVTIDDLPEWEEMLSVPQTVTGGTLASRRNFILGRRQRGAFTRTRRQQIVESFIVVTFGDAVTLTPDGVILDAGGVLLLSGETSLSGLYVIEEQVEAFTYTVRVKNTVAVDLVGLSRELGRITPAGISYTVVSVAIP